MDLNAYIPFTKYTYKKLFKELFQFFLAGLPSFVLAVPLNWLLVEVAAIPKPISYLVCLFFQVTMNYVLLRKFVFTNGKHEKFVPQYLKFLSGISFFRFLDWALYSFLVSYTSIYYLFVQIGNVFLFSMFKFVFTKLLMDKKNKNETDNPDTLL